MVDMHITIACCNFHFNVLPSFQPASEVFSNLRGRTNDGCHHSSLIEPGIASNIMLKNYILEIGDHVPTSSRVCGRQLQCNNENRFLSVRIAA
jgi:hypothetical protein